MTRNSLVLLVLLAFVRPTYADVSVRVPINLIGSDETCGVYFEGECSRGVWCLREDYAPITVPSGSAYASLNCGGNFGSVFAWNASGWGVAQSFQPIGPGGPVKVTVDTQWGDVGPLALEFIIHNASIYDFLTDWFAGYGDSTTAGDFNGDGATTADDIYAFLAALLG